MRASDVEAQTRRILSRFKQATRRERIAGSAWYIQAHTMANEMARRADRSLEEAAAIIALLSPSVEWSRNVRFAAELVETGTVLGYTGYKTNLRKAMLVRAEAGTLETVTTGRSLKVRAFAALIASAGTADTVCVDSHAANVARGVIVGSREAERIGARQYREYAEAYRRAARRAGVRPSTMQATTWLVQKRLVQARRRAA